MKNSAPRPVRPILGVAVLAVSLSACGAPRAKPKDPASETATNIRLAESYFAAGKVNDALGILEKADASQPENAALRNYYGQLCFLAGRNPEAEAAFTKALELDPHLTDARNNLGAVYDATGRKDLAEQQFLKVIADGAYGSPRRRVSTRACCTCRRAARRGGQAVAARVESTPSSGAGATSSRRFSTAGASTKPREQ